jgi:hypothetical protein
VGVYARFQSNPKDSHLITIKRILKHLNDIINYDVCYSKDLNLSLVDYSDVDWAGNTKNKKSTTRECCYVGYNLVAWMNKK